MRSRIFSLDEVLHETIEIHGQPDPGGAEAGGGRGGADETRWVRQIGRTADLGRASDPSAARTRAAFMLALYIKERFNKLSSH